MPPKSSPSPKDSPDVGPLAEKFQQLRAQSGLSLYELEKRSGINRPKLMRIENGTIRQPTTETLNKLAAALDVDPEEFYDAVWQGQDSPMPSLPTYFRSKYNLSDQQIAVVERTMRSIEKKQLDTEPAAQTRATPTKPTPSPVTPTSANATKRTPKKGGTP